MENFPDISSFNKIEFRLVTALFSISVFYLVSMMTNNDRFDGIDEYTFESRGLYYSYFGHYFLPWLLKYIALYIVYLLLHFVVIKNLVLKKAVTRNVIFGIALFFILTLAWFATETQLKTPYLHNPGGSESIISKLFAKSLITVFWINTGYLVYTFLKYNPPAILTRLKNSFVKSPELIRDCIATFAIWLVILLFLNAPGLADDYRIMWVIVVLPGIPVYAYAYIRLVPLVKSKNKGFLNYLLRLFLIACVISFLICLFYSLVLRVDNSYPLFLLTFFTVSLYPIVIGPTAWVIYHNRLEKFTEITGLKTALGQSSANLDFLRSQINPHFLFNALNTLYGTALQENADRTGEGIQKLGDMMRFMLQENIQEQISLMREVDYLNNYIALQKLRTQTSADIVIQTEIDESINALQIAPMLLIPFVENAFKHGISLRESSHIKITLHTDGFKLLFDVYNSIHSKADNDPEKNRSGIGLENVKQRLLLLYPDRHELVIRETAKEFFIHLTIQL